MSYPVFASVSLLNVTPRNFPPLNEKKWIFFRRTALHTPGLGHVGVIWYSYSSSSAVVSYLIRTQGLWFLMTGRQRADAS